MKISFVNQLNSNIHYNLQIIKEFKSLLNIVLKQRVKQRTAVSDELKNVEEAKEPKNSALPLCEIHDHGIAKFCFSTASIAIYLPHFHSLFPLGCL